MQEIRGVVLDRHESQEQFRKMQHPGLAFFSRPPEPNSEPAVLTQNLLAPEVRLSVGTRSPPLNE
jgi:hypothetical protein